MITRFVKLSFEPSKVEEFKSLFYSTKNAIESFNGCIEVKLMQDVSVNNIYFTISKWESEELLNEYRQSELFAKVWTQTKSYFNDKPEAWSLAEG